MKPSTEEFLDAFADRLMSRVRERVRAKGSRSLDLLSSDVIQAAWGAAKDVTENRGWPVS